jgi:adenylate cyclase
LAAASAQMGNATAAAAHAREVLAREPGFTIGAHLATLHYKREADTEHFREGLTKAGLPA